MNANNDLISLKDWITVAKTPIIRDYIILSLLLVFLPRLFGVKLSEAWVDGLLVVILFLPMIVHHKELLGWPKTTAESEACLIPEYSEFEEKEKEYIDHLDKIATRIKTTDDRKTWIFDDNSYLTREVRKYSGRSEYFLGNRKELKDFLAKYHPEQ